MSHISFTHHQNTLNSIGLAPSFSNWVPNLIVTAQLVLLATLMRLRLCEKHT